MKLGLCRALCAALCGLAMTASAETVLRDPAVPEALRHTTPAPATRGAALQAQVEAKLRARFEGADTNHEGHISRAQAEAAGFGYVVQHFEAIDAARQGSVSWAQVRAHLEQRLKPSGPAQP
jgi:hypothetical protein